MPTNQRDTGAPKAPRPEPVRIEIPTGRLPGRGLMFEFFSLNMHSDESLRIMGAEKDGD